MSLFKREHQKGDSFFFSTLWERDVNLVNSPVVLSSQGMLPREWANTQRWAQPGELRKQELELLNWTNLNACSISGLPVIWANKSELLKPKAKCPVTYSLFWSWSVIYTFISQREAESFSNLSNLSDGSEQRWNNSNCLSLTHPG